jgi:hypothetical protein
MDLSVQELEAAINYWRGERPARGSELALSNEVSVLATVYALMIYHRQQTTLIDQLSQSARQLLQTWRQQAHHP